MKKILLILALLFVSITAFAASKKIGSSFIESNYQISTNDDLTVQPDYYQTFGTDNAMLMNGTCNPVDSGTRYACSGILRMLNLQPGYERFVIGSSTTGDQCTIVVTSDGSGNINYDPTQSNCSGIDNWNLNSYTTPYGINIGISESH
ncbi:MAG: hypothetical protein A3E82_07540 [Gammaproteobacteria bacterium RIFCSPHIGHO2_12_FULL_38_11]|nr:MAG: hypothetical protein A3E82_07540 [Gammaproteobacteria bacterium RIFCSPHIGHO2_12_FULL_38_11]